MEAELLDTNIIIRHLTQDNPDQAERAGRLLKQIEEGDLTVTTSEGVLVEVVQILSSKNLYNMPRDQIRAGLGGIVSLRGIKLSGKRRYLRALDIYATSNLDFVDALIISQLERTKIATVLSFDQDFDRFKQIRRREP